MSQSASWEGHNFSNAQGGNVQFYDPNKFQGAPTSVSNNVDQVGHEQAVQSGASNSWNSWNWGNNADQGYATDGTNVQGQGDTTKFGTGETVQSQPPAQQVDSNQYYDYNQWNQGGYDPNNPQQNWQNQSYQNHQGQANQQDQQAQPYWDGTQWQQPGQWVNNFQTGPTPSEHSVAPVTSQAQPQSEPRLANTAGQFYDQLSPDTSGNFSHSSASYFSNSTGLNDSTSSSLDQSNSSQPIDPSGSSTDSVEDSINAESGTVSGFFGKYDDFSPEETAQFKPKPTPTQFLNVNPGIQRTDSAISNASLQTMNYSSQGSVGSLEEVDKGIQDVSNQFQNVAISENPAGDNVFHPGHHQANQNQNSGGQGQVPQSGEEEDKQSANLNDWEIVPDQANAGVNFYIGANQDQAAGTGQPLPQSTENIAVNPDHVAPPTISTAPPIVTDAPPPMFVAPPPAAGAPSTLTTGSPGAPGPPIAGGGNPFRKASPHNVRRNLSNQSLPSMPGESSAADSPVIFGSGNVGDPTPDSQVKDMTGIMSGQGDSIPKSEPNVATTNSAFKPTVPTDTIESMTKSSSLLAQAALLPTIPPDKSNKDHDKVMDKSDPDRGQSKPPVAPSSRSASPRKHTSAFQPVHRAKHSMSPATTLWDNMDAPATNIILAPAAPVVVSSSSATESGVKTPQIPVIPVQASLESKLKDSKTTDKKKPGRDEDRRGDPRGHSRQDSRGGSERGGRSREEETRKKEDDNRSINSLDELDAQMDYRDRDEYRDRRHRDKYGYKDYRDSRDPRDPRYEYDRPSSRTDPYRDYGRRQDPRDPYSRDRYYDERYERPRSRQEDDRPGSRSGQDVDLQRSRDYDREAYQREREKYRGSGYDYYYQQSRYYDDRDAYSYYRDPRDARYSRGYYEELGYYRQPYNASGDYYPQNNGSRSSSRQDHDESQSYARHGYDYDYGYDGYSYGYEYDPQYGYYYRDQYQQEPQGRMTPQKHTIPHVRASFGANGTLVKMLPNRPGDGQPATVEIHSLEEMVADNTEAEELKAFPGPLSRTDTHKNDVLQFCQKKAQQCAENINMVDRESAELIWKLMELIIKQNGSVVGTDIADLLLEGHQPSSLEYSMMGMKITQSSEELDKIGEEDAGVKVVADRSQVNKGRSLEEVTDRFRNLLLYGRKKDALEWATKNNLWGHALFLASKMDTRTHANVMIRFANSAMKMNDPLQTLYQLMSGRQPASVTCVVDERWGDWRPHLAMILSNSSAKPELDRKSIASLGDTMASKGCLHASHFCYIMAQASFGTFSKKTSKIVLIGASHNSAWEDFVTNEAMQCTEVYEYAQSLGNHGFLLPHFQVYKFMYATRLAEYGFLQEALHYCEVIANAVQVSPSWFQPAFVKILYEMANRYKFHDPQRVHSSDEAEDPMWLQQLQRVCAGYEDGSIQPVSGNATPAMFGGTTTSSESGDVAYNGTQGDYQYNQGQTYTQYGQDGGYQQYSQEQTYGQEQSYAQDQTYSQGQTYGQQQASGEQYSQQYGATQAEQTAGQTAGQAAGQTAGQTQEVQQTTQQQTDWQNQYNYNYGYQTGETAEQQPATDVTDAPQHTDLQTYGNQGYNQQQYGGGYGQDYVESDRLASQRGSVVSTQSMDTENSQTDGQAAPAATFDYFSAATTGKIVAPASRYRTTSGSSAGSVSRQRTMSESSTGSVKAAPSMKKSQTDSAMSKKQQSAKQDGKKGWFSQWFGGSGKKQHGKEMHLPKDDKQSIVWDPVNKRWMNTDGDENESNAPAMPPPKDTDLGGKMPPAPASSSDIPAAGAPPSGNRFSLQKGRGARNQYVDVMNTKATSAASVPSNLFNVMPSSTPAANSTQIFNPTGTVSNEASSQPQAAPSSSQNLLEPPGGEPDQPPGPVTNPVMFNPAQFTAPQTSSQPAAGKGPKYGQRRQYPK